MAIPLILDSQKLEKLIISSVKPYFKIGCMALGFCAKTLADIKNDTYQEH